MFLFKLTAPVVTAPAIVVHTDGLRFSRGFDGSHKAREINPDLGDSEQSGVQNSTARLNRACDSRP
jgi:hypothetical protein